MDVIDDELPAILTAFSYIFSRPVAIKCGDLVHESNVISSSDGPEEGVCGRHFLRAVHETMKKKRPLTDSHGGQPTWLR